MINREGMANGNLQDNPTDENEASRVDVIEPVDCEVALLFKQDSHQNLDHSSYSETDPQSIEVSLVLNCVRLLFNWL